MSWTLYPEALSLARPPFSCEYIETRADPSTRWRIRDARDDAVGHADTEQDAQAVVVALNKGGPPKTSPNPSPELREAVEPEVLYGDLPEPLRAHAQYIFAALTFYGSSVAAEDVRRAWDAITDALSRATAAEAARDEAQRAVAGIADDYMTSEQHHPGYVLIPAAKFEQLCVVSDRQAADALSSVEGRGTAVEVAPTRAEAADAFTQLPYLNGGDRELAIGLIVAHLKAQL